MREGDEEKRGGKIIEISGGSILTNGN